MEKSPIYSSAPKPPKQIRVEEDPVEPKVEEQVLLEKKEEQVANITVMHPTVSNNTVVKLTGEKPQEPILAEKIAEESIVVEPTIGDAAHTEGAKPYEVLTTGTQPEAENVLEQTPDLEKESTEEQIKLSETDKAESQSEVSEMTSEKDAAQELDPEKYSTEEQIELGEIDTAENQHQASETNLEIELAQEQNPEKDSTEEQIELGEIDPIENQTVEAESTTETEATPEQDSEKNSVEEQTELAEIDAKTNDDSTIEIKEGEGKNAVEEPYNIEFETTIEEASKYLAPEQINNEEVKARAETKPPTEKASKSSKNKPEAENEFENLKIPGDEELFQRQYYTMGEVATMFHANQSQIRFWENEFDILQPKKNKKGDRYFRPEDVKNLQVIHHLLRNRRFTIEGAREYLKSNKQRTQDTVAAIASLGQLKSFLTELKASL